jgi:Flp pilus assembly protein TadG
MQLWHSTSAVGKPARGLLRKRRGCRRAGTELIEMTFGFIVLLGLSMGMVEFGQYFYIKHCVESAVRDGGRYAMLSTATQGQLVTTLTTTLAEANVTYNASWLTMKDLTTSAAVTDVATVTAGDQLQLTLSTTYGNIPNAVRPLYAMTGAGISGSKLVSATCIMVKE